MRHSATNMAEKVESAGKILPEEASKTESTGKGRMFERVDARTVLWYLVFTGFAVNYMIRINLNIAIVSMVKARPKSNGSLTSECFAPSLPEPTDSNSSVIPELRNVSTAAISSNVSSSGVFDWDEYEQGLALAAFFWVHWTTQIPGGLLANRHGTKLVFGLSNFAGVLMCFAIPAAAYAGHPYLVATRVLQGLLSGFCWPAMHTMTARWIPPNERSKFVTAYLGSSVGAALTFPMCGYIIATWGWEFAFYVCGILGTAWYTAWYFLVFDSPQEHPRISARERDYIVASLGESVAKKKAPVPWRSLLTSLPMWMNVLTQFGGLWGLFTVMTYAPTYFKAIHGLDIKSTGLLSGMPHLFRMIVAYFFSILGDYLLTSEKMSRTNVRKLATGLCCIGQGLFVIALAYSGCDSVAAIAFLTLAVAVHGTVSTGPLASFVDISPNYASISLGIGNGAAVLGGFFSPLIVGYLTYKNQTVVQWQKVFWIMAGVLCGSGTLYVLLSSSELQPWNNPEKMRRPSARTAEASELVALKPAPPSPNAQPADESDDEKDTETREKQDE